VGNLKKILVPEVVTAPRQAGKTTQAIKKAAESGAYIVSCNYRQAQLTAQMAKDAYYDIHYPLSHDEYIGGVFSGSNIKEFIIDDAHLLLSRWAKAVPISMITISQREEEAQLTWREFIQKTIWDNNEAVHDILCGLFIQATTYISPALILLGIAISS